VCLSPGTSSWSRYNAR